MSKRFGIKKQAQKLQCVAHVAAGFARWLARMRARVAERRDGGALAGESMVLSLPGEQRVIAMVNEVERVAAAVGTCVDSMWESMLEAEAAHRAGWESSQPEPPDAHALISFRMSWLREVERAKRRVSSASVPAPKVRRAGPGSPTPPRPPGAP